MSTRNVGSRRVPVMWDSREYREGKIRVSTEKGRIRASTRNGGSGRVPKMLDPGEYREGKIWVSTRKGRILVSTENGDPGEYRKCGIRESTDNVGSGRVPRR